MSETENHKGKLVPLHLIGATLEDRARDACRIFGFERRVYQDSWVECLQDEGYRKVHIRDNIIYEVQDTAFEDFDFVEGDRNDDGSYDYVFSYYNGGASFSEVLDQMITKANRKKS